MICAILCGGAGSRLWPVSREKHPKPFIRLPDGRSLIQKSFIHAAGLAEARELLTLTNRELHFKVAGEYEGTGLKLKHSCILEPFGRNTGPAVAAAALETRRRYGDEARLLILAADHLISEQKAFAGAVSTALKLAGEGFLVTFGIKPDGPETGFGYIEAEGHRVLRFVEKPTREKAEQYYASGRFFWNAGIFCFQAGVMLEEMGRHAPELLAAVEKCLDLSFRPDQADGALELDEASFGAAPDISIDYAIMEKSDRVAMVPCDIGWSDIGSWTVLSALEDEDQHGNHLNCGPAGAVLRETSNCDIHGGSRLVATIGLDNILIVDTPDALLVADKGRVQEVKSVYNELKDQGHEAYRHHRTVHRPWGSYTLLESGPRFKIKRLVIKPGAKISLQMHHHRSEHWIVVSGMAEVTCDDEVFLVDTNESTYIKAGHRHRVANQGLIDLVMIEVQSGDYLGEDDIIRFDDIYGRTDAV